MGAVGKDRAFEPSAAGQGLVTGPCEEAVGDSSDDEEGLFF